MMKYEFVFENVNDCVIRCIQIEDFDGLRSVMDIYELSHEGTLDSLKKAVKKLFECASIEQMVDYRVKVSGVDYDSSLEGRARKRSSKEVNVIATQLKGKM